MKPLPRPNGFTVVELLVGMVVGAIALAGAFRLWKTNHEESYRLQKKTDLREKLALSSKQIQRSITLAGLGLGKATPLVKADEVGSDTLIIYTNANEAKAGLLSNLYVGQYAIYVDNASAFQGASYLAVSDAGKGEVKPIERVQGNILVLRKPLESAYSRTEATARPAVREKYYTDQESKQLLRVVDGNRRIIAEDVRNFQVSFRDGAGTSTEDPRLVRTVQFSFTGVFPAREGAINSLIFTSTAIPRNIL